MTLSKRSVSLDLYVLHGHKLSEKEGVFLDELILCGLEQGFLVYGIVEFKSKGDMSLISVNTINLFIMAGIAKKRLDNFR